jgi:hypothetical protein
VSQELIAAYSTMVFLNALLNKLYITISYFFSLLIFSEYHALLGSSAKKDKFDSTYSKIGSKMFFTRKIVIV